MKNNHWKDIHTLLVQRDQLFMPFLSSGEENREGFEFSDLHQDSQHNGWTLPGSSSQEPGIEDLVQVRASIRDELDRLRIALETDLNERDVYYILFPLVAHIDEQVQFRFLNPAQSNGWPPLQRELFDTDSAGELFYETLDDLLIKPQTLPLILEVYYYCLNEGFGGRLANNPSKRQEYMERLRNRIPTPSQQDETVPFPVEEVQSSSMLSTISPFWFYCSAAVATGLVYAGLKLLGHYWTPF
ncbi:Type IV / VI secretion system, DotU [Desulfonatronospira thiodismutans ASO3-1]|uniref:Type IV / VI secretion system, DotU n=1 Tax=Desulfonatronospira thiodismutans ASO3-1 TaxID=555779 RepID=D6SPP7_9BACT|nr:DotU family type IV/VI secretion system protein [Desulfonatronospira thiodismutans]EFI34723.1 Type IV / VI secretion system, DotU [Desulfonatronospira thiodismutans ASO3-1]